MLAASAFRMAVLDLVTDGPILHVQEGAIVSG